VITDVGKFVLQYINWGGDSLVWPDRYFLRGGVYRLEIISAPLNNSHNKKKLLLNPISVVFNWKHVILSAPTLNEWMALSEWLVSMDQTDRDYDCRLCGLATTCSNTSKIVSRNSHTTFLFFLCTTEKNKRKLLHGGHCSEELDILRVEIRRHGTLPPFSRIKEFSHPWIYLCNQCQIQSKKELESKRQSKIKEIDLRLGLLAERTCERNRKRPLAKTLKIKLL